jgi:hypothetical protein
MPIDDPLDALEQQFKIEDLAVSPVTKRILAILSRSPLPYPFDTIVAWLKEHLAADSLERIQLLLQTCITEVRKHCEEIDRLRNARTAEQSQAHERVSRELLLDAVRRAENTRAKDRVKRIGLILANAVVGSQPTDADEVEEMMRVAMELSDIDIRYLRELIRIEGSALETGDHVARYDAFTRWEHGSWGTGINPEIDSVFSKLESYGLVTRLAPPNNLNALADFQNRYVLLTKGMRFAMMTRQAAGTTKVGS